LVLAVKPRKRERKKAGVVENPQVLHDAGLLFDRRPGIAGPPFV
jgi:hypothetical protein